MKKRMYEKLIVWKEAHELCKCIYQMQQKFPSYERFALGSQMRRSAYSVPMNVVEGNCKRSIKEKLHFFEVAEGSLEELDYQLLLSKDLKYISMQEMERLREHISKVGYLLSKLRYSLQ